MAIDIVVPPLTEIMDSVVLVEWTKDVGEEVVKEEPLFSIETEKAILEVESPGSGILQQMLAAPGEEVEVGAKIGVIATQEEAGRLAGTGPKQMITERDVQAYLEKQAAAPAPKADRGGTLSPTRRTIAWLMVRPPLAFSRTSPS